MTTMHHARKMTDDRRAEAVERLRRGEPMGPIARELGVHVATISRLAQANGMRRQRERKCRLVDREADVLDRLHAGVKMAAIALEFGVALDTVCRFARTHGIRRRTGPSRRVVHP